MFSWSRLLILFLCLLWAPFVRYHKAFICGIESVDNPLQYKVVSPLLAHQFYIPQLSKVEIAVLLQVFDGKFQHIELHRFGCFVIPVAHTRIPWHHTWASRGGCSSSVCLSGPLWRQLQCCNWEVSWVCSELEQQGREPLLLFDLIWQLQDFSIILYIQTFLNHWRNSKFSWNYPFTNLSTGITCQYPSS